MDLRPIGDNQKSQYNKLVTHVIESWQWGEFRKSLGIPVLRYGIYQNGKLSKAFQLTLHKIPLTNQYVGYLPKGPFPDKELAVALKKIGKENNCAFIKVEPDIEQVTGNRLQATEEFIKSPKPLFTKYNFILDLTKSEEELLKNLHPKTRYNIKIAQKHGVKVEERTDDEAFEIYLKLYFETTKRQGYHGHNEHYHRQVWKILKSSGMARLLIAFYPKPYTLTPIPLTAWMLLNFKDTFYYPYGGSSKIHPEVMANNLVAWEAIKLGQKLGLKKFDMWGALGPSADPKDPWFGFHKFKQGYGGKLTEYIGTYDLVFNWPVYWMFTVIDKLTPLKVFLLKLLGK
ncbi:peptidoglycan bridge formation glycyltransferase FemA/FemB family protein [Candidatus Daviesbacteria bacterium]|nr:peptidoglycan bridge formation glycyltransferase FemA/FemB family protein [Candidatus Daviesbacteria bacterium]